MADEDDLPFSVCGSRSIMGCCLNCAVSFFLTLIVYICFVSFIVWTMFRSNDVQFQVQAAELTRFNLDLESNNLHYNLSLNLSIRNSKSGIGIHYDRLETLVYYIDQRLRAVSASSFYQGHMNRTVLETLFVGHKLITLDDNSRRKFEDIREIGVYRIDVKLLIKSRVMIFSLVTWPMKPIVRCHLKVPLGSSNSSGGFGFKSTMCHVDF